MRLRLLGGLAYVAGEVVHGGRVLRVENLLVDTGSAGTVFSADLLLELGIAPEPSDRLLRVRGVGGTEFVFTKVLSALTVGDLAVMRFRVQVGALDYGFPLDGILGLDFLRATKAKLDFDALELST
ncbi:MAG TPA: retropepsin-like aspartic protease [Thermoanaerobaculia bacterium]|nr:retropepsin-like aspartic protease [Thermoanaerobaculia bacterium]